MPVFSVKIPLRYLKEVKAHRLSDWYHKGTFYNARNFCIHRYHCRKTNACGKIVLCGIKCASCPTCNQTCKDFVKERCLRLDQGLFTARNVDLKRKVRFRPRKCHKTQITDRIVFIDRLYSDFCRLNLSSYVEMDTVHSSRDSKKTLLTLFFKQEKLFLAFLMNRCTKGAVRLVFDRLEKRMGTYEFATIFEYILTDRGSEFGDPVALETGISGIQRSSIYYCDPMQSGQKGGIERAHTMLRMILPKGTCFEFLTQWDVNLIVNHINSTPRESLGGRTSYEIALETLDEEILKAFQLRPIEPDQVNLTPKLIRFNH